MTWLDTSTTSNSFGVMITFDYNQENNIHCVLVFFITSISAVGKFLELCDFQMILVFGMLSFCIHGVTSCTMTSL